MSRRVLILAVVVAALAALEGALLLARPRVRLPERLLELDPGRVAALELSRAGRAPLLLARVAAPDGQTGWVVRSEGDLPAVGPAVEGLLQRVLGWRRERRASSDPGAWEQQQVTDEAARHLRLLGPEGAVLGELLVGGMTGVEPEDVREKGYSLDTDRLGLFVRRAGEDTTWVVTDFLTRELEPDPRPWLPRPLVVPPREALRRVTIERAGERFALVLEGVPRLEPDPVPAEPAAVGGLLLTLETLEATGAAPAGQPLPPAALRLRLEAAAASGGAAATELSVAEVNGHYLLQVAGGPALEVAPFGAQRLLELTRASLTRTSVLPCPPAELEQVGLPGGLLQRGPQGWRLERDGQPPRELARERVEAALARLAALKVLAWDPAAPLPPAGAPVLAWLGRSGRGAVQLGAVEGERRAARLEVGPPAWLDAAAAAAACEALESLTR